MMPSLFPSTPPPPIVTTKIAAIRNIRVRKNQGRSIALSRMTFSMFPLPEQDQFIVRNRGRRRNDTQLFVLLGVFCYNPLASRRSRIRAGHGGHSRTGAGSYTHPRLSQGNSSASFHCEVVGPVDRVGGGGIDATVRVLGGLLVHPGGGRLCRTQHREASHRVTGLGP